MYECEELAEVVLMMSPLGTSACASATVSALFTAVSHVKMCRFHPSSPPSHCMSISQGGNVPLSTCLYLITTPKHTHTQKCQFDA